MTFHDVSWRFIYVLTYIAREAFRWRGTSPADVLGRLLVRAAPQRHRRRRQRRPVGGSASSSPPRAAGGIRATRATASSADRGSSAANTERRCGGSRSSSAATCASSRARTAGATPQLARSWREHGGTEPTSRARVTRVPACAAEQQLAARGRCTTAGRLECTRDALRGRRRRHELSAPQPGESTEAPSRRAARAARACPRAAERQRAARVRDTAARRLGRTRDALRGRRRHLQALERTAAQTYPSSCHCGLHLRAQIRPTGVSVRPTVRVEGETLTAGKAARTFRPPGFSTPRALETREQKAIGQRVARAARASGASCP